MFGFVSDIDFIHSDSPFKRSELPHQRTEFILYGRPKAFRLRRPSTRSVSFVTSERSVVFIVVFEVSTFGLFAANAREDAVSFPSLFNHALSESKLFLKDSHLRTESIAASEGDQMSGTSGVAGALEMVLHLGCGWGGGGLVLSHDRLLSGTEAVGQHRIELGEPPRGRAGRFTKPNPKRGRDERESAVNHAEQ
jgi:hypothetical protein